MDEKIKEFMHEQSERIVALQGALKPFADFGGDPKDWSGTVWATLKDGDPVLHNYRSGREVYLRDFINAKKVLEQ